jgi:hypothetical protein
VNFTYSIRPTLILWYGIVWYGIVWYGIVSYGLGVVYFGMV